jgi:hypothetical protein
MIIYYAIFRPFKQSITNIISLLLEMMLVAGYLGCVGFAEYATEKSLWCNYSNLSNFNSLSDDLLYLCYSLLSYSHNADHWLV